MVNNVLRPICSVALVIMLASLPVLGPSQGLTGGKNVSLSTVPTTFVGEDYSDRAGFSIAMAGDVNGDGYTDILVGAPEDETMKGNYSTGQTYLIFGKASGWGDSVNLKFADASFIGEARDDRSGYSVAGAGDVNGDGKADILIGMFNDASGLTKGKAYLILGKANGWTKNMTLDHADAAFVGENDGDHAGYSVASAGDVNGDGKADILIGAPGNGDGGANAGKAYLLLGRATWPALLGLSDADASFVGSGSGERAGTCVAGAGDVNGDGKADILIGADDGISGKAGQAYLVFGKATGWALGAQLTASDASFTGEHAADHAGYSVSGAGDVNGDSKDDIVIGAYAVDTAGDSSGRAYIVLGKATGWHTGTGLDTADAKLDGEQESDRAGSAVAAAGDINKDGFDDILIGAHRNDAGSALMAGKTYIILGRASGWSALTSLSQSDGSYQGEGSNEHSGYSVAGNGDVNKNGKVDILIGTPDRLVSGSGSSAGEVYIIMDLDLTAAPANKPPTATLVSPANKTTVNDITPTLSWNGTDPDGQAVTFDVYFDTDISKVQAKDAAVRIQHGVSQKTHQVTGLAHGQTYYWTAIPFDGNATGACSSGIWWLKVQNAATKPANNPPNVTKVPAQGGTSGKAFSYTVLATDPDLYDSNNISFSFKKHPANMTIDAKTGKISWVPSPNESGTFEVLVLVNDTKDAVVVGFNITIVKAKPNPQQAFPWLLVAVLVIVIACVVVIAAVAISRRRKQAAVLPAAQPVQAMAPPVQPMALVAEPVSAVQPQVSPPQAVPAAAIPVGKEPVEDFDVDAVLLIYSDGRPLVTEMGTETTLDQDILSSMLTAIGDFIKQSFRDETGLNSFETGGRQVLIVKGQHSFMTVVLQGKEPSGMRDEMQRTIEAFEGQYAGVIESWDGNTGQFSGAGRLFIPILDYKERVTIKEEVKVRSALEYYRGYVRLKVGVINKCRRTVADASLRIEFDPASLRLARVEPVDLKHDGALVYLGNVRSDGKKTVDYYLDPLICQSSFIDGHLTYYDFDGKAHHVDMKRRPVDVVCPMFCTKETVNIAMLKRLVSELRYKDSRRFRITDPATAQWALQEAASEVRAHNVQLVREYAEGDPVSGTYTGESWFFGETAKERLVMMARASQAENVLELMVASDNLASQTGLLAELGSKVKVRCGAAIEPLFDQAGVVATTVFLLDKYGDGGAK